MKSELRQLNYAIIAFLIVLALAGGTWSTSSGAGLPQGTIITATPEPPEQPTAIPTARPPVQPPTGPVPMIFIVSVDRDNSVTIRTANFPANTDFDVLMNYYGTQGIGGQKVTTVHSGSGGTLRWTFNIPDFLKGSHRIAIRLQSAKGYFAYNWFWNYSTGGSSTPGGGPTIPAGKVPTFTIVSVEEDKTVTIETANFPANDKFDVLMGKYGTQGVGGIKVTSVDSGAGGRLTFTFTLPDSMKGLTRIAIRLRSPTSGYYAFNWFWNITSSTGGPATPSTTIKIPTFRIQSVVKDSKVTIVTSNFPANDKFIVTMNDYGTRGIGGTSVTTVDSGAGGTLSFTFDIPASMKGQGRIAIRLQSATSGYFAYNWFWNVTARSARGSSRI